METRRWIDLSKYNLNIFTAIFKDDKVFTAIRGDGGFSKEQKTILSKKGFHLVESSKGETFLKEGQKIDYNTIKEAFPNLEVKALPLKETYQRFNVTSPVLVETEKEVEESNNSVIEEKPTEQKSKTKNTKQVFYKAKSKLGVASAMIPKSLMKQTENALNRIEEKYGDIDNFVAKNLEWSLEELEQNLAPEQIDAVALGIANSKRGLGFLLADQTGVGKGRVVASLMRYAILQNKKVFFFTEKENLFSDIWRDICDINSEDLFKNPFILNDSVEITDIDGNVLFKSRKAKEVKDIIKTGKFPEDSNAVFATYSQVNTEKSSKAKFLIDHAENACGMYDESHNAVGDSNTSENIGAISEACDFSFYSSATFARAAQNLAAYKSILPKHMRDSEMLVDVLSKGGREMLEAMSQTLAEDGVLIRREFDMSEVEIKVIEALGERLNKNFELQNKLSPILKAMARLSRKVSAIVENKNEENAALLSSISNPVEKKENRATYNTSNFGVRRALLLEQFQLALKVDDAIEHADKLIREKNEKPFIVIETTMEAMMKQLVSDDSNIVKSDNEEDVDISYDEESNENEFKKPPTFQDALHIMLDRMITVTVTKGKEKEKEELDDHELLEEVERIHNMIDDFPEFSMSPIDDIMNGLKQKGHTIGEISARSNQVVDGKYVKREKENRNKIVAKYNSGEFDALICTLSGSTGLSGHSSPKFKDKRRRHMIELQCVRNIVLRIQFWGRVNRRGQLSTPGFTALSSGLFNEQRTMAMSNKKVADVSATVSGSADNAAMMQVPDVLTSIGNDVAKDFLEQHPSLADEMDIYMHVDEEEANETLYFVNRLLQNLNYITDEKIQKKAYYDYIDLYKDTIKSLEAKGKVVNGTRKIEGIAKVIDREVFHPGDPDDDSAFSRPVYLTKLNVKKTVSPIKTDFIRKELSINKKKFENYIGRTKNVTHVHMNELKNNIHYYLSFSLTKWHKNVESALRSAKPNGVKIARDRLKSAITLLEDLDLGKIISAPNEDEDIKQGVIIDINLPEENDELHLLNKYIISYVLIGDEKVREVSLSHLLKDNLIKISDDYIDDLTLGLYDEAPEGEIEEERYVLDGNIFIAVKEALNNKLGVVSNYEMENGETEKGILIPKSRIGAFAHMPVRTRDAEASYNVISQVNNAEIYTNPENRQEGFFITRNGDKAIVEVSGKKSINKKLIDNDILELVGGKFVPYTNSTKAAKISPPVLKQLLNVLVDKGHELYFDGKYRKYMKKEEETLENKTLSL